MVFQQLNLLPRMDVVSNVLHGTLGRSSTPATLFNLYPRDDILRASDILKRLGIVGHAAKRDGAPSGGQQQRVAIAGALMQDPRIILAEVPNASLEPMNAQTVMEVKAHPQRRRAHGDRQTSHARHRAALSAPALARQIATFNIGLLGWLRRGLIEDA